MFWCAPRRVRARRSSGSSRCTWRWRPAQMLYTTPIKALSNQKYADLVAVHVLLSVGLLTGDVAINPGAPVVVMTTEVVRNMIYAGSSALAGLSYVVMDEVHFPGRPVPWCGVGRGDPAPGSAVRVVSLSATVSNAEEFGGGSKTVRGDTTVIVDEHRPVPLSQHVLVGNHMFDLYERSAHGVAKRSAREVNADLKRYIRHKMLTADDRFSDSRAAAGAEDTAVAHHAHRGPMSWRAWTATGCCPRSCSSSPARAATGHWLSVSGHGCRCSNRTRRPGSMRSSTGT